MKKKYNFAFLIHSRNSNDVFRKYSFAKAVPKQLLRLWCIMSPPIFLSEISGLRSVKNKKEISGCLIGIPMTARQMLKNKKTAYEKVKKACDLADKLGVKLISLGALTSPVTGGGEDLIGKVKVAVTNGNALTSATTSFHVKKLVNEKNIQNITIVGGTGSVGRAVCMILAKDIKVKEFNIIARTREHLEALVKELRKINKDICFNAHINDLSILKESELVVVLTSASEALIKAEHLKQNAIVYDITHPRNVSSDIERERKDIRLIEGGVIRSLNPINYSFNLGLKKDKLFSCLAEVMTLAAHEKWEDFSVGTVDLEKVYSIEKLAGETGLIPDEL